MKDMGKVIGVAEGEICRPDGFRQGQRAGEGGAVYVSAEFAESRLRHAPGMYAADRASDR